MRRCAGNAYQLMRNGGGFGGNWIVFLEATNWNVQPANCIRLGDQTPGVYVRLLCCATGKGGVFF